MCTRTHARTHTHKHAHTHTHTGPPIKVPMRTSDKGHHFVRSHFGHGHFDHDALVVQIHHNGITNNVRTLCGTATAETRGQDLKCPTNALCVPVSVCECVFVCVCVCMCCVWVCVCIRVHVYVRGAQGKLAAHRPACANWQPNPKP